jgi:hypothetical protein
VIGYSFCASCHTQPESTFFQRSVDTQPVDLASIHKADNTRCIDCHSGKGVTGRIRAELLGAHNALAFYTRTAVQPAKLTRPIGDDSCLKCHQNVTTQRDRNNHFHGFLARCGSECRHLRQLSRRAYHRRQRPDMVYERCEYPAGMRFLPPGFERRRIKFY